MVSRLKCVRIFIVALLALTAIIPSAHADGDWYGYGYGFKREKKWGFDLEVGARYFAHYNRVTVIDTPAESVLGEVQGVLWYKRFIGIAFIGSYSIAKSSATFDGIGIKIPFLTLSGKRKAFISGLSLILSGDVLYFKFATPAPPYTYATSGINFRGGGTLQWSFGATHLFLDTTMMVTDSNSNFFIAPFIGFGYQF